MRRFFSSSLLFTKTHEWLVPSTKHFKVGISHYSREMLGDVQIFTFPSKGEKYKASASFFTIETKFSELSINFPVDLEVIRINELLEENEDFYNTLSSEDVEQAWLVEIETDIRKLELMSEPDYLAYLKISEESKK